MMGNPCIVKDCENIGTHRFPKNETRKAQWIKAITYLTPGLTLRKTSKICTAHFRPADFSLTPTCLTDRARKVLKKSAIPSIFPWNQASQQQLVPEEQPPSSSLIFDPSKAQSTYSRTRPITFVEMQPLVTTLTLSQDKEDPLQPSNQVTESQKLVTDIKIELDIKTEKDLIKEHDEITETKTKSVATQTLEDWVQLRHVQSKETQTQAYNTKFGFSIYDCKPDDEFFETIWKSIHYEGQKS